MKFNIEYKKRKIKGGFIGMNRYAAKEHHLPFHHKHRTSLEIYNKVSKGVRKVTEKHEEIEYRIMRMGYHYHPAHDIALKYEDNPHDISKIWPLIKRDKRLKRR